MTSPVRVTLKIVAARARLSVAAVSMALRDHRGLPATTIARVKKLARAMGYAPDPALSALAAYRTQKRVRQDFSVIALVSNFTQRDEWLRRKSAQSLIAGATERARTLGYELKYFWAREEGMSPTRFGAMLAARGIRGIILAPLENASDRMDLNWDKFAVVTVERPTHYTQFPHVVTNYFADMLLAWKKLHERGCRRVGLVVDSGIADRTAHQWEAAFTFEQIRLQAEQVPPLIVGGTNAVATIRAWLRRHQPDAVISRSDGVLEAAEAEHMAAPHQLSYVSLNVIDDAPGVSGILQHRELMGAISVDIIHSLLHRNHRGYHNSSYGTHIDGVWHEGRTMRSRPQGSARPATA